MQMTLDYGDFNKQSQYPKEQALDKHFFPLTFSIPVQFPSFK